MLELKQVGAVPLARGPVVLDIPYPTTTGVFLGDKERVVFKVDKKTLKKVWRKKTQLQVRGGHRDLVLLVYYDEMQGWSDKDDVVWKRKTTQNYCRRDDRLYFIEPRLEIVDVATGQVIESMDCPEGAPALVMGEVLLVKHPLDTDPVRVFHLRERRVLWQRNLIHEMRERHGVDEYGNAVAFAEGGPGRYVAQRGGHLFSVSEADGELTWKAGVHVPYFGVQVRDGRIYAWTTAPVAAGTKMTFDLASGQVGGKRSVPASGENRFLIVDETTGEIIVDRPLAPYGGPFQRFQEPQRGTVCKNHIVFTTKSGLMAVFRLSDGELVWQHEHRDQLFYPVFEDKRLYVACADGTLVVFEAEGGEL
jgi:outer membrane protein assembly factor BamB